MKKKTVVAMFLAAAVASLHADVSTISQADFKKSYASQRVFVIDVRDQATYRAGHITDAVNIPVRQIESRAGIIGTQAQGRTIVTYCSCANEHASLAAAELLSKHGIKNVYALAGGYRAWVKGGGRVSVGSY